MNLAFVRYQAVSQRVFSRSILLSVASRRSLHASSPGHMKQPEPSGPSSWLNNVTSYFRWPNRRFARLDLIKSGENMYILCAEFPDFAEFVRTLHLPDSYQTWLSITLLHSWLCMVRIRREGDDGKFARKVFFKTFFDDVERRTKGFSVSDKERDIGIVQNQLYGSLFAYDEALLSGDDRLLAAALWRDLFHLRADTRPQDLELMVAYTRKQLAYLDNQTAEQIFGVGLVKFLPLIGDTEDEEFIERRLALSLTAPSFEEMKKTKKKSKR